MPHRHPLLAGASGTETLASAIGGRMKTDIDGLLKDWSARHSRGQEHLDHIAGRIAVDVARQRSIALPAPVATGIPLWGKLAYGGLGACLAILVMAGGAWYFKTPATPGTGTSLAALALPSASQRGSLQQLFAETSRLFPSQLRWIVQSNGEVALGVDSEGTGQDSNAPAMLVRLVLVKRAAGETTWKQAWTTDVVMRGEDRVEIAPNRKGHNKVTLWLFPVENGKVAVDTSIAIDHPLRVSGRIDTVIGMGVPAEVAACRKNGADYKLLQTVEPLNGKQSRES